MKCMSKFLPVCVILNVLVACFYLISKLNLTGSTRYERRNRNYRLVVEGAAENLGVLFHADQTSRKGRRGVRTYQQTQRRGNLTQKYVVKSKNHDQKS